MTVSDGEGDTIHWNYSRTSLPLVTLETNEVIQREEDKDLIATLPPREDNRTGSTNKSFILRLSEILQYGNVTRFARK